MAEETKKPLPEERLEITGEEYRFLKRIQKAEAVSTQELSASEIRMAEGLRRKGLLRFVTDEGKDAGADTREVLGDYAEEKSEKCKQELKDAVALFVAFFLGLLLCTLFKSV